ncbi:ABC transporter substrate-binding protein [Saccharospirillum salsuginis]|uniref:Peptide ABC transporter substrate-binding protein n=1 Tax=Saccharospirillum salsuginis TaxID=418750 RepID=A0A918NI00_9GAMM|nr:ABC transporter substrate-binding protein [Saccharospirillum salsuginis]GGX71906.1 peptide ABC transporter substrate-binding protein [Saccharospirillum salsuginis]
MNNRLKAAVSALVLSLPGVSAWAATPDDTLVVAQNIDDIVSIDPAQAYEFSSGEFVANTYDQLVQYDAEDTTTLAPGLATKWTVNAEDREIVFSLRDDVRFHSGNTFDPEDVVYSFKRVIELNKAPAFILTQLGWTSDNIEDMVTAGDDSVTVRYEGDFAPSFVLNVLASRPASIVDAELVASHASDGDMGNAWLNRNSAGTGPFKLRTYRPAELLIMDANDDYFGGTPEINGVIIRHVAEAATQRLLLEAGDVDIAMNLTPDQVKGLSGNNDVSVKTYPQAAVHFLSFNQKDSRLTSEALWEAARYLVDYNGMVDSFLNGQMEVHQSFWPAGFPGAVTETPYEYNPDKARAILEDAGVDLPITVTLDVINSAPFTDMAQALQATFAPVGINFEILPGTGAQVITKYRARTHEAMLLYWGPDFMDPHSNAKAFSYNSDNSDDNYQSTTTWRNAWQPSDEMNRMTMAALTEQDNEQRMVMYRELQRGVQGDSPIVIMFQATKQVAMHDAVDGFVNGAISDYVYYRLVDKNE